MAIKRIPIKGMSFAPSGQIEEDGACITSLNAQLNAGEIEPMMGPKPITKFGDVSNDKAILYIHKGNGYENLICIEFDNAEEEYHLFARQENGGVIQMYTYDTPIMPDIKSVTHVGNTLIVSDGEDLRYFLYKDGEYRHLGTSIPVPKIRVSLKWKEMSLNAGPREDATSLKPTWNDTHWNDYNVGESTGINVSDPPNYWSNEPTNYIVSDEARDFLEEMWGAVDSAINNNVNDGYATFPLFVRFAVRLFDDSLVACSAPILLGADVVDMLSSKISTRYISAGVWNTSAYVGLVKPFRVIIDFSDSELNSTFASWRDVVKGIDFYMSDQIIPVERRSALKVTYSADDGCYIGEFDPKADLEKVLLSHSQVYLVKSIQLADFSLHTSEEIWDNVNYSADWIVAQEALMEASIRGGVFSSSHIKQYNKSLLLHGIKETLPLGYPYHISTRWVDTAHTPYIFRFKIEDGGITKYVFSHSPSGGTDIECLEYETEIGSYTYYERPVAWLAYPDSRCTEVLIYYRTSAGSSDFYCTYVAMKPMPTANVAYAFLGFGISLPSSSTTIRTVPTSEDRILEHPEQLIRTKSSNPFVVEQILSFGGNVLSSGVITAPLSEGQFGVFDLYVFTSNGVYVESINKEGAIATGEKPGSTELSRDILLHPDGLVSTESEIFFAAKRGLIRLSGRSAINVSESIDGRPDSIRDTSLLAQIVDNYCGGEPIIEIPKQIHEFLDGCVMAYDSANSRVLLVKNGSVYVYKTNTNSWHVFAPDEVFLQGGMQSCMPLNSYPDAWMAIRPVDEGPMIVYNFSVRPTDENAPVCAVVLYTREVSLGAEDIYKGISRVKVRGRFVPSHVHWALQGSNDGINYKTLGSLRGPSWKWYRLVIVGNFTADERISYVELEYEPRYLNKIR